MKLGSTASVRCKGRKEKRKATKELIAVSLCKLWIDLAPASTGLPNSAKRDDS